MRGPYQFRREDAEDFGRFVGAKTFIRGDELFFQECPYCRESTRDKKTFSINLRNGLFKCFRSSCGAHGNMITLAKDFTFSLGQNNDEYYRPTRHYQTFRQPKEPIEPKELSLAYLESRCISAEIAERYEITDKDGIIIFPFRDESGDIVTIKYRNPAPKEGQNKEWFVKGCKPILFGMNHCNQENKTLIVTEGQMDSLSVAAAGIENAVSVPGGANSFTWVPYCWDWMQQFNRIIVFGDHEKGKITLYADFYQRWRNKVWCVQPEDYKDCKDANDILRKYGPEQIRKAIENATQPPVSKTIALDEVEDVDINLIKKLPTGIDQLDNILKGGLPFGQVILVTGKSGDGKSTLANQFIVKAIDQQFKTYIYSGELPNYLLKSWIIFQAAGPNHVNQVRRYGGSGGTYEVKPDAKARIISWMKGYAWIYDNRIVTDEEDEPTKLITLLEDVIQRNGVEVILLDNLMTAMDLEPDGTSADKYDRQSQFMKKLARIATSYNVLIILVAHKRKMGSSEANDTVSGSADIVNLASVVLSYERGNEKEGDGENIRWLKVTKNRLSGDTTRGSGIKLEFDATSKRIHETLAEATWEYSWEHEGEEVEQLAFPWEDDEDEKGV